VHQHFSLYLAWQLVNLGGLHPLVLVIFNNTTYR